MSFVGKSVYNVWGGSTLRFGKVVEEKMEGAGVDICNKLIIKKKDDEAHEMDLNRIVNLRHLEYDEGHSWYRIDRIRAFEPSKMIATLSNLI